MFRVYLERNARPVSELLPLDVLLCLLLLVYVTL